MGELCVYDGQARQADSQKHLYDIFVDIQQVGQSPHT